MKKSELLRYIDQDLLDKLYGFCYHRTPSSHAAEELCSDIVFELVKTANTEGEIGEDELYAFVWRVARHVLADWFDKKNRKDNRTATGEPDAIFALLSDEEETEEREAAAHDREALRAVYRRLANL